MEDKYSWVASPLTFEVENANPLEEYLEYLMELSNEFVKVF